MSSDVVIRVTSLGKRYLLYRKPEDRLKQAIIPRVQRGVSWLAKPFGGAGFALSFYHYDFWALRDVSFEVMKGQTVGIIGPNGAGKSTLLQIICGTVAPTEGDVVVNGRIAALLELGAGFNPEFTGRENVYLNGAINGQSRETMDQRFDDIAAFAEIGEFIDQPVKTYSSGMFLRLAFSAAIHIDPEILVVDEALAVGDMAFQTRCLARIRQMQENGTTILLVSHSHNTIVEYCTNAILLDGGRVIETGDCQEVVKSYASLAIQRERAQLAPTNPHVGPQGGHELIGSGQAAMEIVNVSQTDAQGCRKECFDAGETLLITMTVRFNRPVENPCFGINIKTTQGISLWGATTQHMQITPPSVASPCTKEFHWRLPLQLGAGKYIYSLGVGEIAGGEYKRHSRLHYAGEFDVFSDTRAGQGCLPVAAQFEIP
jgi:lipopolysaccharide transport system ATP-binding protein